MSYEHCSTSFLSLINRLCLSSLRNHRMSCDPVKWLNVIWVSSAVLSLSLQYKGRKKKCSLISFAFSTLHASQSSFTYAKNMCSLLNNNKEIKKNVSFQSTHPEMISSVLPRAENDTFSSIMFCAGICIPALRIIHT